MIIQSINYKVFKKYTECSTEEEMNYFLNILKNTLEEIMNELPLSKNGNELENNIHKLKGLSRYAGLEMLSSFCELHITLSAPHQKEITRIVNEIEIILGLLLDSSNKRHMLI